MDDWGVSVGIHWCFDGFVPFNVVVLSKCRELLPGRGLAFTLGPTCSTNWRCLLGISATLTFEIPTGSAHHPRILKSMASSGTDSLQVPTIYKAHTYQAYAGISQQHMAQHMVRLHTLWLFNIAMEAMALIQIDDFPSERNLHLKFMVEIFHGKALNNQRVPPID